MSKSVCKSECSVCLSAYLAACLSVKEQFAPGGASTSAPVFESTGRLRASQPVCLCVRAKADEAADTQCSYLCVSRRACWEREQACVLGDVQGELSFTGA